MENVIQYVIEYNQIVIAAATLILIGAVYLLIRIRQVRKKQRIPERIMHEGANRTTKRAIQPKVEKPARARRNIFYPCYRPVRVKKGRMRASRLIFDLFNRDKARKMTPNSDSLNN
jgi:hypothetical protein